MFKKLRTDVLVNIASAVAVIGIMLMSVPLYLSSTGQARFGVLSVIWIFIGYFGLFDLGLGRALTNRMSKDDVSKANAQFWTAIALNTLIAGIIGILIVFLLGDLLLDWLKLPIELRRECGRLPVWLSLGAAAASFNSLLNGVLEARRHFILANALQVAGAFGTQMLPAGYAYLVDPSLAHLVPLTVAVRFSIVCMTAVFVLRQGGLWKVARPKFALVTDLLRYGSLLSVSATMGGLLTNIDQFIIARQLGVAMVPFYSIPLGLVTRINIIPIAFVRAAFPVLSSRSGEKSGLDRIGLPVVMALMGAICCSGMFLVSYVLEIWLGRSFATVAAPVAIALLAGVWCLGSGYVPLSALEARNRPAIVANLNLLIAAPYLLLQFHVLSNLGLVAGAAVWSARHALTFFVIVLASRMSYEELRTICLACLAVLAATALASAQLSLIGNLVCAAVFLGGSLRWLAFQAKRMRAGPTLD